MSRTLQLSDRRVDLDTGRISTGGELRPMELKVLRYLLRRPGAIVPPRELLTAVWGYAPTAESRTVQVTLHRMRAVLEASPRRPHHLVTLPGRGVSLQGLARDTPPPSRPRLQPSPTPLVGRSAELTWLEQSSDRLITVMGPGGVGKTRLAWEYALRAAGPVCFCSLEDLDQPAAVAPRVAAQLELQLRDATAELGQALAGQGPLTLVLDNAESVGEGLGELLLSWLEQADELRILLTSRLPLGLATEQRLLLGMLAADASRELLLARIHRRNPLFDPEADQAFAPLVQLLDGLPLALEIVAPYVAEIGAQAVTERLSELCALPHREPDVAPRHRSLAAAVRWSLERLPPEALEAVRRLTVFRRWFSLELAECLLGSPRAALMELLGTLIEQGLVYRAPGAALPRFALYTAVRSQLGACLSWPRPRPERR